MDELLHRLSNPFAEDKEEVMIELVKRLAERLQLMESALDELYPGWAGGACLPSCNCAGCGD